MALYRMPPRLTILVSSSGVGFGVARGRPAQPIGAAAFCLLGRGDIDGLGYRRIVRGDTVGVVLCLGNDGGRRRGGVWSVACGPHRLVLLVVVASDERSNLLMMGLRRI